MAEPHLGDTWPSRYAAGDDVEAWLHELLCLDAANHVPRAPARLPHPDECDLFYVSRDTLFSYHRASEVLFSPSCQRNGPGTFRARRVILTM